MEFGKPHPEPYLKAAADLGVEAGDCLAIEDSNTGAKSAEAAGCVVLCVPNHVPILDGRASGLRRHARRPGHRGPGGLRQRAVTPSSVSRSPEGSGTGTRSGSGGGVPPYDGQNGL